MQQALSPKKYIQTRARSLPIYKCFVNVGWVDGGIADVFVMRKHVNDHVTVGFYLVDLLCLGVKDTFFRFNEEERAIMAMVPKDMFMEVDYALAHNIVYAGHDFALDYDIQPSKDFGITQYILEADTDAIPLIEIPTGDEDGLPHLMVDNSGQYSEALAKLRRNAGEGNYRYTVEGFMQGDDDDIDEDAAPLMLQGHEALDDYERGTITPIIATGIFMHELIDASKMEGRSLDEQVTLRLDCHLRVLRLEEPDIFGFDDVRELAEYDRYLLSPAEELNGYDSTEVQLSPKEATSRYERIVVELLPLLRDGNSAYDKISELVKDFAGDVVSTARIFETLMVKKELATRGELVAQMQDHAKRYPYAALMLGCAEMLDNDREPGDYNYIFNSAEISEAFPGFQSFHTAELYLYWITKMLQATRKEDLPNALRYYALITQTEMTSIMLVFAQTRLSELVEPITSR